MDKEEVKNILDLSKIEGDYLMYDGNKIWTLSLLEVKLIEKINDLEVRIKKLEE